MTERLFVYGTLAPGRPNAHVLGEIDGSWEQASVTGWLREEGWGAAMGFPGIDLDAMGEAVQGFLFSSKMLSQLWPALDAFEGEAYALVLTTATLKGGRKVDTHIYQLRTPADDQLLPK